MGRLNERVIVTDAETIDEPGPRIVLITDAVEQARTLGPVTLGSHQPALRSTVEDEAIGIPNGEPESVFDKFIQRCKTQARHGGTGVGLAICREIVGAHGGAIRALPTGGREFPFEVVLPSTD